MCSRVWRSNAWRGKPSWPQQSTTRSRRPTPRTSAEKRRSSTSTPTCSIGGWCGPTVSSARCSRGCAAKPVTLAEAAQAGADLPGAWLGVSFVALVLFVLVFTNARARGREIARAVPACSWSSALRCRSSTGWNEVLAILPAAAGAYEPGASTCCSRACCWPRGWSSSSAPTVPRYWEFGPELDRHEILVHRAAESYTSPQVRDLAAERRHLRAPAAGAVVPGLRHRRHRGSASAHPVPARTVYFLKNVWRAAHVEREINRLVA